MEITACPKCGSKRISMGTMGSGVLYGVTSWKSECKNCGYQGEPLIFNSSDAYNKFCTGLKSQETSESEETTAEHTECADGDDDELTTKEKDFLEFLNEPKKEDPQGNEGIISKNKSWLPEIGLAMVIAAAWVLLSASGLLSVYGTFFMILYGILLFILTTVIFLFIFVAIEYFYKSILKMTKKKNHP